MKKSWIFSVVLLSFLLVLSSCSGDAGEAKDNSNNEDAEAKVEKGINEITFKELQEKLDKDETFLLVTYSASEEDVENSKLVEALDDSFNRAGNIGYSVNLKDESQDTLDKLGRENTHPQYKGDVWELKEDGLVLIQEGSLVKDTRFPNVTETWIHSTATGADGYGSSYFDYMEDIDGGLSKVLDYIQSNNIELTNN